MGTESGLTEAAKSEIAEAIRIVREDRFEKYVRERSAKPVDPPKDPEPEKDPVFDPPKDPKNDPGPTPPPVKDPPKDPDPKPEGRRSAYWGEIFD